MINVLVTMFSLTIVGVTAGCYIVGIKGLRVGIKNKKAVLGLLSVLSILVGLVSSAYICYYQYLDLAKMFVR